MEGNTAIEKAEIGTHELAERANAVVETDDLIRMALREKGGIDVLERIVALREREQERNAEREMAEALAGFQAECPIIKRTGKSHHGPFAPYEEIVGTVSPILAAHGLSFTHDSVDANGEVTTTCTLRHAAGATRTATFTGPYDSSGSKNPIQARSSARSYGKRYTLSDVLGIATEVDDDGNKAGEVEEAITAEQAAALEKLAGIAGDFLSVPGLFDWLGVEKWEDIPARRHNEVERAIKVRVAASRKAEAKSKAKVGAK